MTWFGVKRSKVKVMVQQYGMGSNIMSALNCLLVMSLIVSTRNDQLPVCQVNVKLCLPVNIAKTMDRMNSNNNLCKIEPHRCLVNQIIMPVYKIHTHTHNKYLTILI